MENSNFLLRALSANALFSLGSAVLLAIFGRWVAGELGLADALPVYVVAGLLVLFGLQLAKIVRTRQVRAAEIYAIIAGDLGWVVGSIILVALYFDRITVLGIVLVNVVAGIVLLLAVLQIRGLRQSRVPQIS